MARCSLVLLVLFLLHTPFLQVTQCSNAATVSPGGFIGCFKDWRYRVLTGKDRTSRTNTGEECIQYCKEDGYKYAGTESGDECFCGNYLRHQEQAPFDCTHTCSGNKDEKCGGHWRLSLYDITPVTTLESTSRSTTNTHKTQTIYNETTTVFETSTVGPKAEKTNATRKGHMITDKTTKFVLIIVPVLLILTAIFVTSITVIIVKRRKQDSKSCEPAIRVSDSNWASPNTLDNPYVDSSDIFTCGDIHAKVVKEVRSSDGLLYENMQMKIDSDHVYLDLQNVCDVGRKACPDYGDYEALY